MARAVGPYQRSRGHGVRVLQRHLGLAVSLAVCDVAEQRVLVEEHLGDAHACARDLSEEENLVQSRPH
jgi:hypothetical protein